MEEEAVFPRLERAYRTPVAAFPRTRSENG
jgi:hypothetical protein